MEVYARIMKQGNSLMVAVTKPCRDLGLDVGDWVKVNIDRPDSVEFKELPSDYDPTDVGDKVLRTMGEDPTEEYIRALVETYEQDPKRIRLLMQYIEQKRSEQL